MTRSEKIQSFIAIFIAIIALFISIWQGFEQRKHNRYSVRPLLTFDSYVSNKTRSIRISNDGLGPAIIKEFKVKIDGETISGDQDNPWTTVVEKRNLNGKISEMYYFANGTTMKTEKSRNLLSWKTDTISSLDISIFIKYLSIYEEEFTMEEAF